MESCRVEVYRKCSRRPVGTAVVSLAKTEVSPYLNVTSKDMTLAQKIAPLYDDHPPREIDRGPFSIPLRPACASTEQRL